MGPLEERRQKYALASICADADETIYGARNVVSATQRTGDEDTADAWMYDLRCLFDTRRQGTLHGMQGATSRSAGLESVMRFPDILSHRWRIMAERQPLTTPHAPCTPNCMQNAPAARAPNVDGRIQRGMNAANQGSLDWTYAVARIDIPPTITTNMLSSEMSR